MYKRGVQKPLLQALADTPVVFLQGPRQSGKSTLVREILKGKHKARYVTLDDPVPLSSANADPDGFLAGFDGPVAIDEVQRVPGLFRALKAAVDRNRRPGRFLLTGSAQALLLPRLAEMLAGRMEVVTLWPLAQVEMESGTGNFVERLFGEKAVGMDGPTQGLWPRVTAGGFPEVVGRREPARRGAWFDSYVSTILQRDVLELSRVDDLTLLPRLFRLAAARTGGLLNTSELARSLAAPLTTLKRHLALFEVTFLVQTLPAWSSNRGKRLVKSPKLYLSDSGLLSHFLGWNGNPDPFIRETGMILENFVATELRKMAGWASFGVTLHHYRTFSGREVDFVLEGPGGRLVGVEVKSSAVIGAGDFKGLRELESDAGARFHRGVILYTGKDRMPFGKGFDAVPIGSLWV